LGFLKAPLFYSIGPFCRGSPPDRSRVDVENRSRISSLSRHRIAQKRKTSQPCFPRCDFGVLCSGRLLSKPTTSFPLSSPRLLFSMHIVYRFSGTSWKSLSTYELFWVDVNFFGQDSSCFGSSSVPLDCSASESNEGQLDRGFFVSYSPLPSGSVFLRLLLR